jgi:hypothetical protein
VEAAGAVDAENAPTAPWKTAKRAVSHSSHRSKRLASHNPQSHFRETSPFFLAPNEMHMCPCRLLMTSSASRAEPPMACIRSHH